MESRGIPCVLVVTEPFEKLGQIALKYRAYGDVPIVVFPHPFDSKPVDEIQRIADEKVMELLGELLIDSASKPTFG